MLILFAIEERWITQTGSAVHFGTVRKGEETDRVRVGFALESRAEVLEIASTKQSI
jgi:hypothetical protein